MTQAAFFRCEIKPISRGKGHSATAAAAYRSASVIVDERTGIIHDYRNRKGVLAGCIFGLESAPEGYDARTKLWNEAEAAEVRSNARVARDVIVALPCQLDTDDLRREAAYDMAAALAARYQTIVDANIHAPSGKGDERNYHVHLLMATRDIARDGFGDKLRALDDKQTGPQEITAIREMWAEIGNRHLLAAGYEPSLDARSLDERGIDRLPEPTIGSVATAFERAGRPTNAGDDAQRVRAFNALMEEVTRDPAYDPIYQDALHVLREAREKQIDHSKIDAVLKAHAARATDLARDAVHAAQNVKEARANDRARKQKQAGIIGSNAIQSAQEAGQSMSKPEEFEKQGETQRAAGTPAELHLNPPGMGNPRRNQAPPPAGDEARRREDELKRESNRRLRLAAARAGVPVPASPQTRTNLGNGEGLKRGDVPAAANKFSKTAAEDGKGTTRSERLARYPHLAKDQQWRMHQHERENLRKQQEKPQKDLKKRHDLMHGETLKGGKKRLAEIEREEGQRHSLQKALDKFNGKQAQREREKALQQAAIERAEKQVAADAARLKAEQQQAREAQARDHAARVQAQQDFVEKQRIKDLQAQAKAASEDGREQFNKNATQAATQTAESAQPNQKPTLEDTLRKTFGDGQANHHAAKEEFKQRPTADRGVPENDNKPDGPKPNLSHKFTM